MHVNACLVRSVIRTARHVLQTDSSARDRETRRLFAGITFANRRAANSNAWRHSRGDANSEDSIKSVSASRQDKTPTPWSASQSAQHRPAPSGPRVDDGLWYPVGS